MIAMTVSSPLRRSWMGLLIGLLLAGALVQAARARLLFDLGAAGLGGVTTAVFGNGETGRIHCTDRRDEAVCLKAYHSAGSPPAVLWLGNSQLHSINRPRRGEETAPMRLHRALRAKGLYLVAFSQANANLSEHLFLFRRLTSQYRITTLILPVCLNQFREMGVRDTLKRAKSKPDETSPTISPSVQANVEQTLNTALASRLKVWQDREGLQGGLNYAAYVLRNRLLGINAQSKRPVSESSYADKMATLEMLLTEADRARVQVILYVPPFRRDVANPYVDAQYARLRKDLGIAAARHKARFLDLTDIVPGPSWGMLKDPILGTFDYDFMHFTAEGHRRLSDNLMKAF